MPNDRTVVWVPTAIINYVLTRNRRATLNADFTRCLKHYDPGALHCEVCFHRPGIGPAHSYSELSYNVCDAIADNDNIFETTNAYAYVYRGGEQFTAEWTFCHNGAAAAQAKKYGEEAVANMLKGKNPVAIRKAKATRVTQTNDSIRLTQVLSSETLQELEGILTALK